MKANKYLAIYTVIYIIAGLFIFVDMERADGASQLFHVLILFPSLWLVSLITDIVILIKHRKSFESIESQLYPVGLILAQIGIAVMWFML